MNKLISIEEAVNYIKDGMVIMIGGFGGTGCPDKIIDAIIEKGVENLTVITNDASFPHLSTGKLLTSKVVSKFIGSHIGTNKEVVQRMINDEIEVEFSPQGTFAERIRVGGTGLGGVLTPTGIGTLVEEGKRKIEIDGKEYILELPLRADVALIGGSIVDKKGNIFYKGSTNSFNSSMATAADLVIVEAEELVEIGEIHPSNVMTPGILVDYIVGGEK